MQKYPMRDFELRSLRHLPVLGLAALVAILPMLVRGPSCGHDFDFHIVSWLEAANQFAHLHYPHWAYTPAYNAGEPRFVFYPPLSWTLGAVLGLLLPWNLVPAAFTWVALTLSGLTMHRLASRYASASAALFAATLYLANPYMLFTAYERTAYGELLAAAWLPLLFAAALPRRECSPVPHLREAKVGEPARRFSPMLRIAIPLTLLWLTNAPAAVMGSYALAFLTLIRLARPTPSYTLPPTPLRLAVTTAAGTALGLALAGFYIVPAAYEQRFVKVNMAVIPGMRPSEHFLFHRMGSNSFDDLFHDQVVRTASIIALILLAAILAAALGAYRNPLKLSFGSEAEETASPTSPILPLLLLTLLIAFLLTPPSLFLWNHIPKLAFLQFPWRLCALLGVILATLSAIALGRVIGKRGDRPTGYESVALSFVALALASVLVFPAWHLFHQPCDPEDTVSARVALFHSNLGTDATDEYTPIDADGDALKPGDPPYWLIPFCSETYIVGRDCKLNSVNAAPPTGEVPGSAPNHLVLNVNEPKYVILNRRAYPAWEIRVNGKDASRLYPLPREDGLIVVPIPAGADTIDLSLRRTFDEDLGLAVSGAAALTMLLIAWRSLRRRTP